MPPLQPGKIVNAKGKVVNAPVKKTDSANVRENRTPAPKPKPQSDTVQQARVTAAAIKKYVTDPGPNFNGVGSNFYKAPDPVVVTTTTKGKDSGGTPDTPQPVTVISAPVASGLVDNINIKEEYQREARRIILALVKSAKDLLIKYDFASINRVAEYALDSDNEARTEYVVSQTARPEPPFTASEAAMQDRFSRDVMLINDIIGDAVSDSIKLPSFGTVRGIEFLPGRPRISNGVSSYDMRIKISAMSDKQFHIKCYEIS
jgi:hypothetical protein